MDSIKYQQIKNLNLTASVRNFIMDHVWIFHQDNSPKQTSKSTQKCVTEHKMKLLLWPEPCRKWVRWTEEKKLWVWRIWRDSGWRNGLWSLIKCSPNSSGIIGENSAVTLGKGRCNNWVPIIVANVNYRKRISQWDFPPLSIVLLQW